MTWRHEGMEQDLFPSVKLCVCVGLKIVCILLLDYFNMFGSNFMISNNLRIFMSLLNTRLTKIQTCWMILLILQYFC